MRKLEDFKDIHIGDRCFLFGTGPSLNNTNLSLIKNEIIFGANTLYKGLNKFGLKCNYYGIADDLVFRNHWKAVFDLNVPVFLTSTAGRFYVSGKDGGKFQEYEDREIYPINWLPNKSYIEFSTNLEEGTYWGGTVIYESGLQVCFYMGFKEVYLVGCDCDYTGELERFDGSTTERRTAGAAGDWGKVFAGYRRAREVFEVHGRKIYNSTVGGKLEIFERIPLEALK
jgi:hypothetical protein